MDQSPGFFDSSALNLILLLIGWAFGLVVGSVISAIWLRLAFTWLNLGQLAYGRAFKIALLVNFAVGALAAGMAGTIWMMVREGGEAATNLLADNILFFASPIAIFQLLVGSVLAHACVFAQMLSDADGTPLRFSKSAALTIVYLGLSTAFTIIATILITAVALFLMGP